MTPSRYSINRGRHPGIALVWVAILATVFVAFLMLSVDMGYVYLSAHRLQNAADSGALAGANIVMFDTTQAVTNAVNAAAANSAAGKNVQLDSNAGDVVIGTYSRTTHTFSAGGATPNAVKVIARRTSSSPGGSVNLFFGPIFNINTSDITRQSIAMTNTLGAGLIVLNGTANPSVMLQGGGNPPAKINLTNGGAVVVDSNSTNAIDWTGHPYINASELDVVGNETSIPGSGVYPSGTLNLNAPVAPDPLSSLPEPAKGTTQNGNGNNLQPGYYPSGISGSHTLAAGVYYIDGGIDLKGGETLNASAGCLLFLHTGGISMKGTSDILLTPPATGTYAGISLYSARGNTSDITLKGNTGSTSSGTIYVPSAHVDIQGNPTATCSQLICDTVEVQGSAQLNVNYDGRNPIKRHRSFLVE